MASDWQPSDKAVLSGILELQMALAQKLTGLKPKVRLIDGYGQRWVDGAGDVEWVNPESMAKADCAVVHRGSPSTADLLPAGSCGNLQSE